MEATAGLLTDGDILFLVETVLPERSDPEQVVPLVRDDPQFVEALLSHERTFERLTSDEEMLLKVTPQLFFSVLLRRARKDLEAAAYTYERRQGQRVAVFDTRQAAGLLGDAALRDYMAMMLASFTCVRSATWRVRVRRGIWRKRRFSDLDIDGLIRHASAIEEESRFEVYKRIGDVCLFLTGMFPEYIEGRLRYPQTGAPRPTFGGTRRAIEDYEREGSAFYDLAAGHRGARATRLSRPLSALAANFNLAEKPIAFLSEHYLRMRKDSLFGL